MPLNRIFFLVGIGLLVVVAAVLLAISRSEHDVSLRSVAEIWADVARDADHVGRTVTRVSAKREIEIGQEIEGEIFRYFSMVDDPELLRYVSGVGDSLLENIRRKKIKYRFYVVQSPQINAYAIPGGGIFVTTGMLDFLHSEAELATIVGHEIIHVDLRHCIERLQYELLVRKVVGRDLALIARIGYGLFQVGFSEQYELEADAGGVVLASKAGYDPRAARAVFERLARAEAVRHYRTQGTTITGEISVAIIDALEQYFATHPPATLRAAELASLYTRSAPLWRDKQFYAGRSNHEDHRSRRDDERPQEWQRYEKS